MKRKHKLAFGITAIVFAIISASIGFGLLGDVGEAYTFPVRFILEFTLMVTPVFTMLAVINLLKNDK